MTNSATEILLARIGALSQLGSLALIALFVGALARSWRHRAYLGPWAMAWAGYAAGLAAIAVRYSAFPVDGAPLSRVPDAHPLVVLLNACYTTGKLGFLAFLLLGTREFVQPAGAKVPRWWLAASLPAAGIGLVALGGTLDRTMILQCVLAMPVFVGCTFLTVAHARRGASLGTTVLGTAFGAHAVLWTLYGVAFAAAGRGSGANPLQPILTYNSYIDAVIQTLLAYGMVLVVMEQATRDSQVAHAELEIAHHALRKAAYTDPLSGALNRRAFTEGIGLEALDGAPATVVLLDADNLKSVNDSLGHQAGDALIRHLANTLQHDLRAGDALYRWGGDEFLMVLPATGVTEATARLDRALHGASSVAVGGVLVPVRASAGYASLRDRAELDNAILVADHAMYDVKALRRSGLSPDPAGPSCARQG